MIQVRRSVFETNSSSSHSIVVMKEDRPVDEKAFHRRIWHGVAHYLDDDLWFERTFKVLSTWRERLGFAIASYRWDKAKIDTLIEQIRVRFPEFEGVDVHDCRDADDTDGYPGWIDHQSSGLLQDTLFELDVPLIDFVLNDRYIVIIDGDEYNYFDALLEAKVIDMNAVSAIYNPWEVLKNDPDQTRDV